MIKYLSTCCHSDVKAAWRWRKDCEWDWHAGGNPAMRSRAACVASMRPRGWHLSAVWVSQASQAALLAIKRAASAPAAALGPLQRARSSGLFLPAVEDLAQASSTEIGFSGLILYVSDTAGTPGCADPAIKHTTGFFMARLQPCLQRLEGPSWKGKHARARRLTCCLRSRPGAAISPRTCLRNERHVTRCLIWGVGAGRAGHGRLSGAAVSERRSGVAGARAGRAAAGA